jgi:hypothetical protein
VCAGNFTYGMTTSLGKCSKITFPNNISIWSFIKITSSRCEIMKTNGWNPKIGYQKKNKNAKEKLSYLVNNDIQ